MLNGARNGHFTVDVSSQAAIAEFKRKLRDALSQRGDGPEVLHVIRLLLINGERAGFSIVARLGRSGRERELEAIALSPEYRELGYGRQFLGTTLRALRNNVVYVRCARRSQRLYEMLLRRGFEHLRDTADGFRVLKRDAAPPPVVDGASGIGDPRFADQVRRKVG